MTVDITDATLFTMQGQLELVKDTQYVGKKGYELRKVQVRKPSGEYAEFEFFGQDIPDDIEEFQTGEAVTVTFTISQREYNGTIYTKLSGKGLAHDLTNNAPAAQAEEEAHEMPF